MRIFKILWSLISILSKGVQYIYFFKRANCKCLSSLSKYSEILKYSNIENDVGISKKYPFCYLSESVVVSVYFRPLLMFK